MKVDFLVSLWDFQSKRTILLSRKGELDYVPMPGTVIQFGGAKRPVFLTVFYTRHLYDQNRLEVIQDSSMANEEQVSDFRAAGFIEQRENQ